MSAKKMEIPAGLDRRADAGEFAYEVLTPEPMDQSFLGPEPASFLMYAEEYLSPANLERLPLALDYLLALPMRGSWEDVSSRGVRGAKVRANGCLVQMGYRRPDLSALHDPGIYRIAMIPPDAGGNERAVLEIRRGPSHSLTRAYAGARAYAFLDPNGLPILRRVRSVEGHTYYSLELATELDHLHAILDLFGDEMPDVTFSAFTSSSLLELMGYADVVNLFSDDPMICPVSALGTNGLKNDSTVNLAVVSPDRLLQALRRPSERHFRGALKALR